MTDQVLTISQQLSELHCCILIPTYNNEKTLKRVIDGVLVYTKDIIIINDGSTDATATQLKAYPFLSQIHFPKNRGKGSALKSGFKQAEKAGYHFAITIDSDGQHFPSDIPVFLNALLAANHKDLLLIGARNMSKAGAPRGNSFGNKFSNFWYWIETGISLEDTQSGYRLYPLKKVNAISYFTTRFEFEIEVIVKAAWNGVVVKNVPIQVLYDEAERVTHFRPLIDFARISLLNTWLVFVALLYIKPRHFFRAFKKKGLQQFLLENVLENKDSNTKKSLSIMLGVFIGLSPFWGFHAVLALFLATILRLNKIITFAFASMSLPPFIPFIIYSSLKIGQQLMGGDSILWQEVNGDFEVKTHLLQYVVGSLVLGTILGLLFGGIGYLVLQIHQYSRRVRG